jgi:uncharacterized protein YjbI with pentapeptide repeats
MNKEQFRLMEKALKNNDISIWNKWRHENPGIDVELCYANFEYGYLKGADLSNANLSHSNLYSANLEGANLKKADLSEADLTDAFLNGADLTSAYLWETELVNADLSEANFCYASLYRAYLHGAILDKANFNSAMLAGADLAKSRIREASFSMANLNNANLSEATLIGTDLTRAWMVGTRFAKAHISNCRIYGISAWDLHLEDSIQEGLLITEADQPAITVCDIEMAQFIYLLLSNPKIRKAIDTIGRKVVLTLGRFTKERKIILDALQEELKQHDYVPILFDFDKPTTKDLTETIVTLAHLSRFIIADITDPSSIPKELEAIAPTLAVPIQPIIAMGSRPYSMFADNWKYNWILKIYEYDGLESLNKHVLDKIIIPAEEKAKELISNRNASFQE